MYLFVNYNEQYNLLKWRTDNFIKNTKNKFQVRRYRHHEQKQENCEFLA